MQKNATSWQRTVESAYHRLLARGVAQYYDLRFEGAEDDSCLCTLHASPPQDSDSSEVLLPMRLLDYIQQLDITMRQLALEQAEAKRGAVAAKVKKSRRPKPQQK